MAYTLPLTAALRKARWKVKIRDKETREPPHVTILRGTDAWRIDLRTGEFMDASPDPSEVPKELIELVKAEATWQLRRVGPDVSKQPGCSESGVVRWQ